MGNSLSSIKKVNFEDVQLICRQAYPGSIMINTLGINEQKCLIYGTILAQDEENMINQYITSKQFHTYIIIYGKNCNDDDKIFKKYKQLTNLGFKNIYIYLGGLFEWLLLQDIYGDGEFSTTCKEPDILKYKTTSILSHNNRLLTFQ